MMEISGSDWEDIELCSSSANSSTASSECDSDEYFTPNLKMALSFGEREPRQRSPSPQSLADEVLHFVDHQRKILLRKDIDEPLGIAVVESGPGSLMPTVIVANLSPEGVAARSGKLAIGDHLLAVDGNSLVGVSLSVAKKYLKMACRRAAVRFDVVQRLPVVDVIITRPSAACRLGMTVQAGVICNVERHGAAAAGGARTGHRIIEVNGRSAIGMPPQKLVQTIASSDGQIHLKTMLLSIYRLLVGDDAADFV